MNQRKIIILTDWYYPGHKAGGPVQSVYNLARLLSKRIEVRVISRNTDLNSNIPYEGIEPNKWIELENNHHVMYLDNSSVNAKRIKSIIKENKDNYILINGLFSFYFSLLPAWYAMFNAHKLCFIAVRGMLHRSALSVKPVKKRLFLAFAKGLGLYQNLKLLASNEQEVAEIKASLGKVNIGLGPNIPAAVENLVEVRPSGTDKFTVLFLGRISPEKNPLSLVKAMSHIDFPLKLMFAGAEGDPAYTESFRAALKELPAHVELVLHGDVKHSRVAELLASSDVMALPSLGENFGHAIFESLAHSVPVVIGNNTPWHFRKDIDGGKEIDPLNTEQLASALASFASMESEEIRKWRIAAHQKALDYFADNNFEDVYSKLFS